MEVWDPEDKPTVFCEIKKRVEALFLKKKRMTRVIVPGSLTVFCVFILSLLLSGCSTFNIAKETAKIVDMLSSGEKKEEKKDDTIIITDLPPLEEDEMSTSQKIACIKVQPECNQ
jgi:hypothetical protein